MINEFQSASESTTQLAKAPTYISIKQIYGSKYSKIF